MPNEVVHPSPWFMIIYGFGLTYNDRVLQPGDMIEARDPQGVLCGQGTLIAGTYSGYINSAVLRYTPIYGDDPYTVGDQGAVPGDRITFDITTGGKKIKGVRAYPKDVTFQGAVENQQFGGMISVHKFVKPGDVNGDGVVDLADLATLTTYLTDPDFIVPAGFCKDAADMNHDLTCSIADLSTLIKTLTSKA